MVDFKKLEYMNSSTVPPLIRFINGLNVKGIKTMVNFDRNSRWQALSFKSLEIITMQMKYITIEGRDYPQ